jgi:hypothetical protein
VPTPAIYAKLEEAIYSRVRLRRLVSVFLAGATLLLWLRLRGGVVPPISVALLVVPTGMVLVLVFILRGYSSNGRYLGRKNSQALRLFVAIGFDVFLLVALFFLVVGVISLSGN